MNKILLIPIVLNIFIIYIILLNLKKNKIKKNKIKNYEIPKVEFPFKNIKDENGKFVNIVALSAPFRSDEHKKLFKSLRKKNIPILGITSYLNFPGKIKNKYEDQYHIKNKFDYINKCIGWAHCFRNPNKLLKNVPKLELSESDFYNINQFKESKEKDHDFIYVCLSDHGEGCSIGWQAVNRNWDLAKKCLPIMCKKYNLKGLIIGRSDCDFSDEVKKNLTLIDFTPYHEFIKKMSKCKFIFLPNVEDASPRVLTEALVLNLPALVNKNIIGGWKYINNKTGQFFTDENDLSPALEKIINNYDNYEPRKYYGDNYNIEKSGKKLKEFIKKLHPNLSPCKYLKFL